ncbi:ABC transporter permease [Cryptosporangium minutisporangium]|uniref:Transport permease protein n=1 Tax=Cryptosporangium minutisporangium TaxID=113569 RepID=A0ABP6T502_9ACTN
MTTLSLTVRDSVTMLRRNTRHLQRYPAVVLVSTVIPVMLLLLFVGVFGALGETVPGGDYIDYLAPGVLIMTIGYGSSSTAQAVNRDMTEGIIQRFRTMAIARSAVLTGHVLAALLRTVVSLVLALVVAGLLGFRPDAGLLEWLAIAGLLVLMTFALSWLAVAVGLAAPNVEGTTGFLLAVQLLPFLSSAFVPTESMSGAVRWFAENQPFTPMIDTLRALLLGTEVGSDGPIAVAWCVGFTLVGYLWARAAFRRAPAR